MNSPRNVSLTISSEGVSEKYILNEEQHSNYTKLNGLNLEYYFNRHFISMVVLALIIICVILLPFYFYFVNSRKIIKLIFIILIIMIAGALGTNYYLYIMSNKNSDDIDKLLKPLKV